MANPHLPKITLYRVVATTAEYINKGCMSHIRIYTIRVVAVSVTRSVACHSADARSEGRAVVSMLRYHTSGRDACCGRKRCGAEPVQTDSTGTGELLRTPVAHARVLKWGRGLQRFTTLSRNMYIHVYTCTCMYIWRAVCVKNSLSRRR